MDQVQKRKKLPLWVIPLFPINYLQGVDTNTLTANLSTWPRYFLFYCKIRFVIAFHSSGCCDIVVSAVLFHSLFTKRKVSLHPPQDVTCCPTCNQQSYQPCLISVTYNITKTSVTSSFGHTNLQHTLSRT